MSAGNGQAGRFSLAGKTAVVTGGHRGIGEAISLGIARAGGDVIVIDRKGPSGSKVPSGIEAEGRRHAAIKADLSDPDEVLRAAKEAKGVAAEWGTRVDTLVNNAGIALLDDLGKLGMDMWEPTMAVNLRAPMIMARELATGDDGMVANGGGVIVNVTSVAGQVPIDLHGAYCASKAGLDMLTRSMTLEWAPHGVRADAVAPTVVLTDMGAKIWGGTECGDEMLKKLPAGRFAEPHEISDVVIFLCSDAAAMIHGQTIPIDGGFTAT